MCNIILLIRHTTCRACGSTYEHPEGTFVEELPDRRDRTKRDHLLWAGPKDVFFTPRSVRHIDVEVNACQDCFMSSIIQPDLWEVNSHRWAIEDRRKEFRAKKAEKAAAGEGDTFWTELGL